MDESSGSGNLNMPLEGLLKHRLPDRHLQRFRFKKSGWALRIRISNKLLREALLRLLVSRHYTLKTTGLDERPKQ